MNEFWLIVYRSYPDADVEAYRLWANELECLHRLALDTLDKEASS